MIKYGVIGTQLLYDDLQYWDSLYIAGRMQKPVLMLKDYAKLPMARKNNLDAAFTLALLLLPQCFSLQVSAAMGFGLCTLFKHPSSDAQALNAADLSDQVHKHLSRPTLDV